MSTRGASVRWLRQGSDDAPDAASAIGTGPTVWVGELEPATGPPLGRPSLADEADALSHPVAARVAFLRRRALLRGFVADRTGTPVPDVVVAYDPFGAPMLTAPAGLSVSSASRDGWAALALAQGPVGVDIELVGRPAEPAWNILHPVERDRLAQLPESERWTAFLRCWTGKEAYLKAIGLGLSREPREVAIVDVGAGLFTVRDRSRPVPLAAAEAMTWTFADIVVQVACVVLARRR